MARSIDEVYDYLVNMKEDINKRLDKIENKGSESISTTKLKI